MRFFFFVIFILLYYIFICRIVCFFFGLSFFLNIRILKNFTYTHVPMFLNKQEFIVLFLG